MAVEEEYNKFESEDFFFLKQNERVNDSANCHIKRTFSRLKIRQTTLVQLVTYFIIFCSFLD